MKRTPEGGSKEREIVQRETLGRPVFASVNLSSFTGTKITFGEAIALRFNACCE